MRLIDKDALIKFLGVVEDWRDEAINKIISNYPTVDASPVVRGEWIQKHHIISLNNMTLTGTYPTCNLCDYAEVGMAKKSNCCTSCGKRLEVEQDG